MRALQIKCRQNGLMLNLSITTHRFTISYHFCVIFFWCCVLSILHPRLRLGILNVLSFPPHFLPPHILLHDNTDGFAVVLYMSYVLHHLILCMRLNPRGGSRCATILICPIIFRPPFLLHHPKHQISPISVDIRVRLRIFLCPGHS